MELYRIQYFMAVAKYGTFSEAARRVHVSQPSLSTQIRLLEEEVGAKLLDRGSQGTQLTSAGERFLMGCHVIIQEVDQLKHAMERREYQPLKRLRIGIQPLAAASLLPAALKKTLAAFPQQKLSVRERVNGLLLDLVYDHEVDLSIMTLPTQLPDWAESRLLMNFSYLAFVPKKHPLANRKTLRFKDLFNTPLLLFRDPVNLEQRLMLAATANQSFDIVFISDTTLTVLEMASHGFGVAILPSLLSAKGMAHHLKPMPLAEPELKGAIGAVWLKDRPPQENAFYLLDQLTHKS